MSSAGIEKGTNSSMSRLWINRLKICEYSKHYICNYIYERLYMYYCCFWKGEPHPKQLSLLFYYFTFIPNIKGFRPRRIASQSRQVETTISCQKEFTIDYQQNQERLKELSNNMLNSVYEKILHKD